MGVIIYDGVASNSKRFVAPILIERLPNYKFAEFDYETEHVPGRNGDILVGNNSFKNVERSYQLAIADEDIDFHILASQLTEWLTCNYMNTKYKRLEDSYEPDYYRMAIFKSGNDITNILGHAGRVTVTFECKPQRYLKTGDNVITINTSGTIIYSPTLYTSRPCIKVYGAKSSGEQTLTINGVQIKFNFVDSWTEIDSETYSILGYDTTTNKTVDRNNITTLVSNKFPTLVGTKDMGTWYGSEYVDVKDTCNKIEFTSGITKVEVIPRWWTL